MNSISRWFYKTETDADVPNLKVVKLDKDARIPVRSNPTDAGADLFSTEATMIHPGERKTVGTGISMEIPEGLYGRVAPRSGLAAKHGVDVLAGVVDSSYRGEIKVVLLNTDKHNTFHVEKGDRIAQIIIESHFNLPFVECENLGDSIRGSGGFGSTGK
jgi:dUTP pyrophosphatase